MNYTEEEFFGEQQVTKGQNNNEKPNVDVSGTILVTFLKTLLVIVVSAFYILTICVGLFPESAVKVFEALNANRPALICYERVYNKTQTLADLYNLVQKSISAKDYKRTSKYISELRGKNGYNEFCFNLNAAVLEVTEDKYIAFVGDLDGYLVSQNILALYQSGKKIEAKDMAYTDLYNENIYSFGFSAYIECVLSDDSLTEQEKKIEAIDAYSGQISGEELVYIDDLIDEREDALKFDLNDDSLTKAEKILRIYTGLKIANTKLSIYDIANDESSAQFAREEIEELQEIYNALIN